MTERHFVTDDPAAAAIDNRTREMIDTVPAAELEAERAITRPEPPLERFPPAADVMGVADGHSFDSGRVFRVLCRQDMTQTRQTFCNFHGTAQPAFLFFAYIPYLKSQTRSCLWTLEKIWLPATLML